MPLKTASWRLGSGDAVVLGDRDALAQLSHTDLRHIVARHRDPRAAAAAILRTARRRRGASAAVAVIYAGSLGAVPEMATRPNEAPAIAARPLRSPRKGASPIWLALMVAAMAVGASLWARRPDVSGETIGGWLRLVLIPTPSGMQGAQPTPRVTPTALLPQPAPRLASPRERDTVLTSQVTLHWTWDGRLAEDEAFDVRVWRTGMTEASVGLVRTTEHITTLSSTGWYEWTVVVVQEAGGRPVSQRSPPAPGVQFYWLQSK
jgi:hypothetical protein